MINFGIGPSRLTKKTREDIKKAIDKGILEMSHRSAEFNEMSERTIREIREFFQVPDDYKIFYTDSATRAMELSILNCCRKKSFHFVNGNFSNLFARVSDSLGREAIKNEVGLGEINDFSCQEKEADLVAVTHIETSSGVEVSDNEIERVRKNNSDKIFVIDITSSAGLIRPDLRKADIWFFSVQKCLGLPAGLGIMFVSSRAFEKGLEAKKQSYFNFANFEKKMSPKFQTICTPNVLNIYLLGEKLERWNREGSFEKNYKEALAKKDLMDEFVAKSDKFSYFVKDESIRGLSLFYLQADPEVIEKAHEICLGEEMILGKGYGELKNTCLRIANFPAISREDLEKLLVILK